MAQCHKSSWVWNMPCDGPWPSTVARIECMMNSYIISVFWQKNLFLKVVLACIVTLQYANKSIYSKLGVKINKTLSEQIWRNVAVHDCCHGNYEDVMDKNSYKIYIKSIITINEWHVQVAPTVVDNLIGDNCLYLYVEALAASSM